MNNIVIDNQSAVTECPSQTLFSSAPASPDGSAKLQSASKCPLRLNGIYSNDLHHLYSHLLSKNKDDSHNSSLPIPSPTLIERDILSHPQTKPETNSDSFGLGSQAGALKKSQHLSFFGIKAHKGSIFVPVPGLQSGIGLDVAKERGDQKNGNCIVTAHENDSTSNYIDPNIKIAARIQSQGAGTWALLHSSTATSQNCRARVINQGCVLENSVSCELAGESQTSSSNSAKFENILNIQEPGEALSEESQIYSNRPVSIVSASTNLAEPEAYVPRDSSSLNRADVEEVSKYQELLWPYQRRQIQMIKDKIALHPQRYEHNDYLETATFLILSDWNSTEKFCFCSIPSRVNRSGRCCMHQFCPYCCWKVRTTAQLRYVPAFYEGIWHWLTGSFKGDLGFTGADGFDWLHYWNAYDYAFRKLLKEGLISGAYWTEELAVNSFLPAKVLPHIHAIIDAHELTETTIETIKGYVAEYLAKNLEAEPLKPDMKLSGISDQKSLLDRIGYMNKPMKLLKAYQQAWPRASFHNRNQAWKLNSELTDLIKGHSQITHRRPKIKAIGTLQSRRKEYIGIKKEDLRNREHQELINELKSQPTEFICDATEQHIDESTFLKTIDNICACTASRDQVRLN